MSTAAISVDEFQALEQKVLRAVEIVKREREARTAAEAEAAAARADTAAAQAELATLREQLDAQSSVSADTTAALQTLERERSEIRQRVETMLAQMDELL